MAITPTPVKLPRIRWSDLNRFQPIRIRFQDMTDSSYLNARREYILFKGTLANSRTGRLFEVLVPTIKFNWAMGALPVDKKTLLRDKPSIMVFQKEGGGKMRIISWELAP